MNSCKNSLIEKSLSIRLGNNNPNRRKTPKMESPQSLKKKVITPLLFVHLYAYEE